MSIASNLVISPVARDAGERTLTLAQGGWLATANYLGYLAGALICMATVIRPAVAIRFGLVCVASFTMAMAASDRLPLWVIFRFLAGLASAFVLVGVSAWAPAVSALFSASGNRV
jgi:MFS family permease